MDRRSSGIWSGSLRHDRDAFGYFRAALPGSRFRSAWHGPVPAAYCAHQWLRLSGILANGQARFAQEFLKQRVHGLEAVRVSRVIPQQYVILEEENIIFAAVEEDQAVLKQFVQRSKIFSKECTARFRDYAVLHFGDDVGNLLAHPSDNRTAGRLQLGQTRFDDVRLLASFEMLATLPDPLLAFQDEVAKLIAEFKGEVFENRQAE